jgi:hypothetical protein
MNTTRQTFSARIRFGKWAGAWLGALAWFADQQLVSMTAYANCPVRTHEFTVSVAVGCILLACAGAWASWRARRALPDNSTASPSLKTDRFIATMSLAIAALSILAIVFGTAAGVILRCER